MPWYRKEYMECSCMIVRFLGLRENEKRGCGVCGARKNTSGKFVRSKRIRLLNNTIMEFEFGKEYEVDQLDAKYLLSLTYKYLGKECNMFAEVR